MTLRGLVRRLKRAMAAFFSDSIAAQLRAPYVPNPQRVFGLTQNVSIDATARLIVDAGSPDAKGRIVLGRGVYLGRFVEVATTDEGQLTIGDDTSIQDYSVIIGDVTIGAHCLFSLNTHVTSSTHHIHNRPTWLIRDQDRAAGGLQPRIGKRSWPVVIEDDCWIGWGAVILSGVYVGRGAVVGSNSVVTRDIPPYEVHAGAPNQCVSRRLAFEPPTRIDAMDDLCLPYFYRGFQLSQQALTETRKLGVVTAGKRACVVLARSNDAVLRIIGRRLDGRNDLLTLTLCVNGIDCGSYTVDETEFVIDIPLQATVDRREARHIPVVLRDYTYVEVMCEQSAATGISGNSDEPARYGIRNVMLLAHDKSIVDILSDDSSRVVVR